LALCRVNLAFSARIDHFVDVANVRVALLRHSNAMQQARPNEGVHGLFMLGSGSSQTYSGDQLEFRQGLIGQPPKDILGTCRLSSYTDSG